MQNAPDLNRLYRLQYKHRLSAPDLEAAIKNEMVHLCDGEINEMRLYLREVRNEIKDYFAETADPMQRKPISGFGSWTIIPGWMKMCTPWPIKKGCITP